jgi:hypothetical protein
LIEALLLDVERGEDDADAREVFGERLSAGRLASIVSGDGGALRDRRGGLLAEQRCEDAEGELPIIGGKAFGFLPEEPLLQLLVVQSKLLAEGTVLVPLAGDSRQSGFELGDAPFEASDHRRQIFDSCLDAHRSV